MKKMIVLIGWAFLLSVTAALPSFAEENNTVGYGGSTTTAPDSYGHWVQSRDGSWSFISNDTGSPMYGWIVSKHQWYYIAANGRMVIGWQKINYETYYFSEKSVENQPLGSLYMNTFTPDNYRVDSKGIRAD